MEACRCRPPTFEESMTPPARTPLPQVEATWCCAPVLEEAITGGDADTLATAFKALSDPVRLRLLSLIGTVDEMCACDLPEMVDRTQPTVSHHLKILVEAGLLTREQRGKWAWFRVVPERVATLRDALAVPARD
jgi:ArsR family transcriptional regulator, arsenate/arsenite/antimonite-responsive transcriptional repressor